VNQIPDKPSDSDQQPGTRQDIQQIAYTKRAPTRQDSPAMGKDRVKAIKVKVPESGKPGKQQLKQGYQQTYPKNV
jgi:hypothetical protein